VAQDPDTRWTPALQTLTFSLVSDSSGFFAVSIAGQISLTAAGVADSALNFESTSSYSLVVQVRDSASTPLSTQATVIVSIRNLNEPPRFNNVAAQPGASAATLGPFSILENATNLALVGTSLASSPGLIDPEEVLGSGLSVSLLSSGNE
jgi:hypothetical protein